MSVPCHLLCLGKSRETEQVLALGAARSAIENLSSGWGYCLEKVLSWPEALDLPEIAALRWN